MMNEAVHVVDSVGTQPLKGSAGQRSQLPGKATTVSNIAMATGGIGRGKMIEIDRK